MDPKLAEFYGTNTPDEADLEKLAAAELAEQLAGDDNDQVNIEGLDNEQLEQLAAHVLGEDGEGGDVEAANDGEGGEEVSEETEKVAEADYLGRVMAHSMVQELRSIEKTAAEEAAMHGPKHVSALRRHAGNAANATMAKAKDLGGKGVALAKSHPKKAIGGGLLAAAGAGAGLHKAMTKKSSALDTLVEQRAMELLAENGIELEKEAGVKEMAGRVGEALKKGGKRYGELLKGGKKGEYGEMAGRRAGNSLKGAKQMRGEAAKSHGARAATALGAGGAAFGAKKAFEKKSSALETLIEQRAMEILAENGVELEQEKTSAEQGSEFDVLASHVEQQAVELLIANGFEFEDAGE
jgi:hypothetical protein